eukprot:3944599-Pyramimonas_sp.AAC.1
MVGNFPGVPTRFRAAPNCSSRDQRAPRRAKEGPGKRPRGSKKLPRQPAEKSAGPALPSTKPVSYTHLTLPTILLV